MWRLFKENKNIDLLQESDRILGSSFNKEIESSDVQVIAEQAEHVEVKGMSDKIIDIQETILSEEDATDANLLIEENTAIITEEKKAVTKKSASLDGRLKAIQDIVANVGVKKTSNNVGLLSEETSAVKDASDNTAKEEDLSKFDSFLSEPEIAESDEINSLDVQLQNEVEHQEIEELIASEKTDENNEIDNLVAENNNELPVDKEKTEELLQIDSSGEVFSFLEEDYTTDFLAGILYDSLTHEVVYNYNMKQSQLDVFSFLFTEINEAASGSNFPKLNNYFVLDLQENQLVFILTFSKHHFALIFNKEQIELGYILSILKPQITRAYMKFLKTLPN